MLVYSTAEAAVELSGTTNLISLLLLHLKKKKKKKKEDSDFNQEKQVIGRLIRGEKKTDRHCREVESTSKPGI